MPGPRYELDPRIDTIIEIGGQDAKFTTMRDGMVTFSHMNTVCAAGTGSFLEEQASRLGCDLADYEGRVRGARAPLSSDRCAVFMERDINNFLAAGFLHRGDPGGGPLQRAGELPVKGGAWRGNRGADCLPGGNGAEQGAGRRLPRGPWQTDPRLPLLPSHRCPWVCPPARGGQAAECRFLGLAGLREEIPVRTETCSLCRNHCRLRIATVAGRDGGVRLPLRA